MMLVGGGLRVALATTHLALKDVPAAITAAELERTLRILDRDLRQHFGVAAPTILVAGLNPHAGEGGHMGREEIEVIAPLLDETAPGRLSLLGPLPADTLFTPRVLNQGDAVLAMYHDQGLATLKYASFGEGVNVTLGLPIIRTSVDHGTALDLAGSGKADPGSLDAAIDSGVPHGGSARAGEPLAAGCAAKLMRHVPRKRFGQNFLVDAAVSCGASSIPSACLPATRWSRSGRGRAR